QMLRPEAGAAGLVDSLAVPEPGPGEVRIRVAHAAICGTDRHIYHWDDSVAPMLQPPVTIGHEFCGHVESIGAGVNDWRAGDYVSAEMHLVCGKCRACLAGNQHVCEKTRIAGLHRDGAFAEFVVLPAANLVRLDPEVVPPEIGAFLDALGNAVHTVQSASSIAGRHVLISGYGAIGAMAAAVVEFEGAASLTINEVHPQHLERARRWAKGLNGRVPVRIHDPRGEGDGLAESVRSATGGGVDVVLEMSGAPSAINLGLELLYPGGELMMLGIPAGRDLLVERFSQRVIFKGLALKGVVGRRMFGTWIEMLGLLKRGLDVRHIVTHRLPMSEFKQGIELLDAGAAHKVVLDPSK
ncbi:MAG: alcohol dehydrogenase catalytic domain-containing protein, partial [Planctomycetota bacterium]|nr:alcohol dehydrogenase catalytic domain-containing protein [Planctomycetota bacterium]